MALLFMDGFDRYGATSELSRNYNAVAASNVTLLTTGGSFGGGAVKVDDDDKYFEKNISGNPQTCVISFRVFRTGSASAGDKVIIIDNDVTHELFNLQTTSGTSQIEVHRGSFTPSFSVLLGTFTLPVDSWQWVTIKLKSARDGAGSIDIEVQGVNVFSFTGQTARDGTETCNLVRLGGDISQDWTYDDIIITDIDPGAPFNDLLPDTRIETLLPDAAGDSGQFTATPAVASYLNVDDVAPDDDTTYVESSTLTHKDLHNLAALPITVADIKAVNVFALAKNPLGGGAALKLLTKSGTTEGAGAVQPLGSGYGYINELFLTNPDTSVKWTESEVNAMQAGYENA